MNEYSIEYSNVLIPVVSYAARMVRLRFPNMKIVERAQLQSPRVIEVRMTDTRKIEEAINDLLFQINTSKVSKCAVPDTPPPEIQNYEWVRTMSSERDENNLESGVAVLTLIEPPNILCVRFLGGN